VLDDPLLLIIRLLDEEGVVPEEFGAVTLRPGARADTRSSGEEKRKGGTSMELHGDASPG
jgi:hypothetical protein